MEVTDLLGAAGTLGTSGLLIALIFWMETNNRRDRRDHHADNLAAQRDATEANLKIATALEALKTFIMGRSNV